MRPESNKAKKPWEYVKLVEGMNITGVTGLYAELCEIVHPAAASVLTMVVESEDGWRLNPSTQGEALTQRAQEYRGILSDVLMACFSAPLLTLRVLHKFGTFRKIGALRKYDFKDIGNWSQIDTHRGGKLVMVGLFGGAAPWSLPLIPMKAATIAAATPETSPRPRNCSISRAPELCPIQRRPLSDASEALEGLKAGRVVGRVVLTP